MRTVLAAGIMIAAAIAPGTSWASGERYVVGARQVNVSQFDLATAGGMAEASGFIKETATKLCGGDPRRITSVSLRADVQTCIADATQRASVDLEELQRRRLSRLSAHTEQRSIEKR